MRFGGPWLVFKKYGSSKVGYVCAVAADAHVVATQSFAAVLFDGFDLQKVVGRRRLEVRDAGFNR
jgi:hypothetical protein